jgi:hypothetical protein
LIDRSFADSLKRLNAQRQLQLEVEDEHSRHALYQAVQADRSLRPQLLECLAQDPDSALVESVLAALLELVPSEDQAILLSIAVPGKGREFLVTRAREVDVLRRVARGAAGAADLEEVIAGTDWLQRRVVARPRSPQILERLAAEGRTRRVRNAAVQALRANRLPR